MPALSSSTGAGLMCMYPAKTVPEYALTQVQYIHLGVEIPLVIAVCGYIIIMEIISVLENIVEVNPELGKFFSKYLSKLKEVQKDDRAADDHQQEGE